MNWYGAILQVCNTGSITLAEIMALAIVALSVLIVKDIIINIGLILGKFKFDYKTGELK